MSDAPAPGLTRALGLWRLVFYALGTIIGAGIYVLLGEVAGRAGASTPLSFITAGALAALTGLSYAELAARHPEAAGAAAYVRHAFNSDALSRVVGLAIAAATVVAAASIARGSAGYLQQFVSLPDALLAGGVVVAFTAWPAFGDPQRWRWSRSPACFWDSRWRPGATRFPGARRRAHPR